MHACDMVRKAFSVVRLADLASGRELTAGSDGTLAPDDCLVIETPGGGGLGAACERDPNLIQHDMLQGLVT